MHGSCGRFQDFSNIILQEMESTTVELDKLLTERDDYKSQGRLYSQNATYANSSNTSSLVNTQVHELSLLRRSFCELEKQHVQLRKQYEEEVHRLRSKMSRLQGTRPISGNGSLPNVAPNGNVPSDSRYKRPSGLVTSTKSAVPLPGDCPAGVGPNQFQEAPVVHKPKVPTVHVSLLHTFTHGRYVICHINLFPEGYLCSAYDLLFVGVCFDPVLTIVLLLYSVVCCVQFSPDGKYIATGSNRLTHVYDAKTGLQKWYVISLRHIKKVRGTLTITVSRSRARAMVGECQQLSG
jgi:hypothetical protein